METEEITETLDILLYKEITEPCQDRPFDPSNTERYEKRDKTIHVAADYLNSCKIVGQNPEVGRKVHNCDTTHPFDGE